MRVEHRVLAQGAGRIAIVAPGGRVEWEVPCPHSSHDIAALDNGNFLLHTAGNRVVEMTPDKRVVWEWVGQPVGGYTGPIEIHGFQRLKNGRTLVAECGNKRIVEVERDGRVAVEIPLTVERPDSHRDTRRVRKLDNGHYLVSHEGMGLVREYDGRARIVWEYALDLNGQPASGGPLGHGVSVFCALRLRNGDTLIGGGNNNRVFEVNRAGKVVWSVERDELKWPDGRPIRLNWVTGLQRLPNGNTVIGNTYCGDDNPQLIEVTRDKKVVWTFHETKTFGTEICAAWLLDAGRGTIR